MFKVTVNGINRLDIELSGKLDVDEMKIAINEFIEKAENIKNGTMLYDIIDFHLPSLGAIAVKFSQLLVLFNLMRKFDRVALLAVKTWLRKISEFEGVLFPNLEIKAFTRDEKVAAEAWLVS